MRNADDISLSLAESVLLVRGGWATSRRDLASHLGISPTTAGFYADELIQRGFLRETGLEQGAAGRPKRRLETVSGAGWFAGVEFHAERLRAVGVDFSGRRLQRSKQVIPENSDAAAILDLAIAAIRGLAGEAEGPLLGIGFGSPGIVDPASGVAVAYAFSPGWSGVPVADILFSHFRVPVTVENNLRVIALAERWFGGAELLENYVILGPRSGFGAAVVQDGKLTRGQRHGAGEIGYWPWMSDSGEARLHDRLSSPAVWRRLAGKGPRAKLPEDLHEALAAFAEGENAERDAVVADFAKLIAMLHWVLDPEVFFLHGPLTALGSRFCQDITEAAAAMAPAAWDSGPVIEVTKLDDEAGALGAASLAMEEWQPTTIA